MTEETWPREAERASEAPHVGHTVSGEEREAASWLRTFSSLTHPVARPPPWLRLNDLHSEQKHTRPGSGRGSSSSSL